MHLDPSERTFTFLAFFKFKLLIKQIELRSGERADDVSRDTRSVWATPNPVSPEECQFDHNSPTHCFKNTPIEPQLDLVPPIHSHEFLSGCRLQFLILFKATTNHIVPPDCIPKQAAFCYLQIPLRPEVRRQTEQ